MKKILAIAVASAIAAPAMADMTISGTIVAGYSSNTADYTADLATSTVATSGTLTSTTQNAPLTQTGTVTSTETKSGNAGFGVDTASIKISGSETLENGLTVSGYMTAAGLSRTGIAGENAGLTVAGDFGSFEIAETKAGSGTFGFANVGGAEDFSAELSSESTATRVTYKTNVGDIAVAAGFSETLGVGAGQDDGITPELTLTYGGVENLTLMGKYWKYSDAAKAASADKVQNGMRVGVAYDMGMAKVAYAWSNVNAETANKDVSEQSIGLAIPAGAATIGAVWAVQDDEDTAKGKREGISAAVKYALSSNVAVSASYATWDSSTSQDEQKSSVLMSLAF
jgi:hypothetical protein